MFLTNEHIFIIYSGYAKKYNSFLNNIAAFFKNGIHLYNALNLNILKELKFYSFY